MEDSVGINKAKIEISKKCLFVIKFNYGIQ